MMLAAFCAPVLCGVLAVLFATYPIARLILTIYLFSALVFFSEKKVTDESLAHKVMLLIPALLGGIMLTLFVIEPIARMAVFFFLFMFSVIFAIDSYKKRAI